MLKNPENKFLCQINWGFISIDVLNETYMPAKVSSRVDFWNNIDVRVILPCCLLRKGFRGANSATKKTDRIFWNFLVN